MVPVGKFCGLVMLAALLLGVAPQLRAQGGTEIIRGRVYNANHLPLAGAVVRITGLVTQASLTATTDAKGQYTALFTSADGDYLVSARAVGYAAVAFRLRRSGLSSVLPADITLTPNAMRLDTITVTALRGGRGERPSIGGVETDVMGAALFALDPSSLVALAGLTAGVLGVAGDSSLYSVLGAASNQNSTVVDGMKFSGDNLPRDAIGSAKLITSTFDPARGQFSGGQLSIRTKSGTDVFAAVVRAQTTNRFTTWADATSPYAPPRIQLGSGSVSGPIVKGKLHYLVAADLSANARENYSLLSGRESLQSEYGLSEDTVTALRSTLGALGVPVTASGIPGDRQQNRQTMLAKLDWTPTSEVSLTVTANGNLRQQGGDLVSQLGFPTSGRQSRSTKTSLGLSFSGYLHGALDEFSVRAQRGSKNGSPYLSSASGSVRVGTQFEGGRDGLTSLDFGGSGSGNSSSSSTSVELTNEISWLTADSHHRFKIGQSFEGDWEHSIPSGNRLGSYEYQTLADLAANRPASYSRTLDAFDRPNRGSTTGLWLGDEWRASAALQFQGGVRTDIGHQGVLPAYNPLVDSLFGLRTDNIPNPVGLSPRLGFSWASKARRGGKGAKGPSFDGTAENQDVIAFASGSSAPGFTISGGAGAFRGLIDPEDIAALVDATGLPSTTRYLACAGAATPIPDWATAAGTIADHCLDGTGGGVFSVSQPRVHVADPSFRPPVSWRGNLGVDGLHALGWALGAQVTYSLGLNDWSDVNVNLRRTPLFTLASEGNRPVFAAPGSIVPSTGVIAPGASRLVDQFGSVTSTLSDLHNEATQVNLTLVRTRPIGGRMPLTVQYVYSHQRAQQRGFDGTTGGDPFLKEWGVGNQPTHQFVITATPRVWWISLGIRLDILSGRPYTPTVVGDINGDGLSNDRAFIADPSTASDPLLSSQMADLLAAAPAGAAGCLRAQFGHVAGRNSCRTGWQFRTDLNLNFAPPENIGLGNRLRVTTNFINTTGALVRLFGLENSALGRSASSTTPDDRLLYVTGFDPATARFRYQVNQLFGEPSDYGTARRRFAPFQVQIGLEYRLGGPPTSPVARSLGLIGAKGSAPLTAIEVRDRLRQLSHDPLLPILSRRDSIALTDPQAAQLDSLSASYRRDADATFAPVISWFITKGGKVSDRDLSDRIAKVRPALERLSRATVQAAAVMLTAAQRELFPKIFPSGPP